MTRRALPLREATLAHHAARVEVPTYDRAALAPAVVHISVGAFHRSHQAAYFDDIAQRGISRGWGLTGVGLRRPEMRDALLGQDGLYTLLVRGADGDRARVIGAITRYLFAPEEAEAVLAVLADPATRLVTLTITGTAYAVDPADMSFHPANPSVAADLAAPGPPTGAIGLLVEALGRRRRAGAGPFTVLSCDNMPGNGRAARTALVEFARVRDAALADWIETHVAFPSCMVDRITPRTTEADRLRVEQGFGVADRWPVVTEPFSQWIVEDAFCAGRPPLDEVGAQFVSDVTPYALMKTRLLNASHCALGHLGVVAGLERIDEAMRTPVFRTAITRMMEAEVSPLLPPVPGVDLAAYRASLCERFANPAIGDALARLCRSGSTKVPTHVLSSIRQARRAGRAHPLLTLAVAGFCRHARGTDEHGRTVTLDDPLAAVLQARARAGGVDPRPLLALEGVFGDLGADAAFGRELATALEGIERLGVRGALGAALRGDPGTAAAPHRAVRTA